MSSMFRLLLLLALAASSLAHIAYSQPCSGSISQYVPAVMGESGGLVKVTETMAPGNGNVFVTINPHIGLATQDSLDLAVAYADLMAGFTAERDMGTEGAGAADTAIRDAINQGLIPGPRLRR